MLLLTAFVGWALALVPLVFVCCLCCCSGGTYVRAGVTRGADVGARRRPHDLHHRAAFLFRLPHDHG